MGCFQGQRTLCHSHASSFVKVSKLLHVNRFCVRFPAGIFCVVIPTVDGMAYTVAIEFVLVAIQSPIRANRAKGNRAGAVDIVTGDRSVIVIQNSIIL